MVTATSNATYSEADIQTITAQAHGGMWPFCSASGSVTHQSEYALDSHGHLTVTHTLNPGQIQIWGVSWAPPA